MEDRSPIPLPDFGATRDQVLAGQYFASYCRERALQPLQAVFEGTSSGCRRLGRDKNWLSCVMEYN